MSNLKTTLEYLQHKPPLYARDNNSATSMQTTLTKAKCSS